MEPITLETHPESGHSSEYTERVARTISEAVRVLNYATYPGEAADAAVPFPATANSVLGSLRAAAEGLDQLLEQLDERLAEIADEREIVVGGGPHVLDPAAAMDTAHTTMTAAREAGRQLYEALGRAQSATTWLGVRLNDDELDDEWEDA